MVFVTVSGPTLFISPWKDGLKPKGIAIQNQDTIRSVLITFPENDGGVSDENVLNENGLMDLFESVATGFPRISSVTISGGSFFQSSGSPSAPGNWPRRHNRRILPPVQAISALLRCQSLRTLCLVQMRLLESDSDMDDFIDAIRVHPALHTLGCSECVFAKKTHLDALHDLCLQKRIDHFFLDGPVILEEEEGKENSKTITITTDEGGGLLTHPLLCYCII